VPRRLLLGLAATLGDEIDDGLDDAVEILLELTAQQEGLPVEELLSTQNIGTAK
jgi:antitoxin component of RelBE/YafQ-DinJ toxin-antitoxin module